MHKQEQLPFYVAGTLPPEERAAVEQHLATCAACRQALQDWERIARVVRSQADARSGSLPPLHLPATFPSRNGWSHSPASMEEKPMQRTAEIPLFRTKPTPAITWAAALLAIVLFAAALIVISLRGAPEQSTPGGQPQDNPPAVIQATATPFVPTEVPFITSTATPVSTLMPGEQQPVLLEGIRYEAQEWNNSGPATLAMALSYWGWDGTQDDAARWLKPDPEDKSVTGWQMVTYVQRRTGYDAVYRMGGSLVLLRDLVVAGFPVIIETGLESESDGWLGHHALVMGWEDPSSWVFHTYDSYLGQDRAVPYQELDAGWRQFNRSFLVVTDPSRTFDLQALLGGYTDAQYAAQQALNAASSEAAQNSTDLWAWFNMGTSYTALNDYPSAVNAYDHALQLDPPFRLLWYQFGLYEAYYQVWRYDDLLAQLEAAPEIEQAHYWRGVVHAAQGLTDAAGQDFAQVVAINPNFFACEGGYTQSLMTPLNQDLTIAQPTAVPPAMIPWPTLDEASIGATQTALPTWEAFATQYALTPTAVPPIVTASATPVLMPSEVVPQVITATPIPMPSVPSATFTPTPIQ